MSDFSSSRSRWKAIRPFDVEASSLERASASDESMRIDAADSSNAPDNAAQGFSVLYVMR
jgi:hypothetical protein